ncbi:hypothetical protein ACFYTG_16480 [Streptomyces mirabilis]|uniref:hypothetical protein n=1 Tax=Streptomyces mirabilis TaxID=68239 RepID=UPI00369B6BC4
MSNVPSDQWLVTLGDFVVSRNTRPVGELNPRELGRAEWVSDDKRIGAVANLVLAPDGSVGVSQVVIGAMRQDYPERMVTSSVLREIPLGTVVADATKALLEAKKRQPQQAVLQDVQTDEFKQLLRDSVRPQPGKTRQLSDQLLKTVALLYLEEYGAGRGMQKRIAERLGELLGESVADTQVRDWISAARRRGWLTTGQAGRRAAGPGWKLLGERGDVAHPGVTTADFLAKIPGIEDADDVVSPRDTDADEQ